MGVTACRHQSEKQKVGKQHMTSPGLCKNCFSLVLSSLFGRFFAVFQGIYCFFILRPSCVPANELSLFQGLMIPRMLLDAELETQLLYSDRPPRELNQKFGENGNSLESFLTLPMEKELKDRNSCPKKFTRNKSGRTRRLKFG